MSKIKTYIRPGQFLISDRPYMHHHRIRNSIGIRTSLALTIFVMDHYCAYDVEAAEQKDWVVCLTGLRLGKIFSCDLKGSGHLKILPGDVMEVCGCRIIFQRERLRIMGNYETDLMPETAVEPEGFVTLLYKRSPRIMEPAVRETILLDVRDAEKREYYQHLMKRILPSLGMLLVTAAVGVLTRRGLMLLISGLTSVIVMMISVSDALHDRREKKRAQEKYEVFAKQQITAAKLRYAELKAAEEKRMRLMSPSPAQICRMINEKSSRLYERKSGDEDFLRAALGYAVGSSSILIKNCENERQDKEKNHWMTMAKEIAAASLMTKNILEADLKDISLGMTGSMTVMTAQLHGLITSLCFFHSYLELQIIVIADDPENEFGWMRYLPHTYLTAFHCTGILTTERLREQTGTALEKMLRDRRQNARQYDQRVHFQPHLLFVIRDTGKQYHPALMQYLLSEERQDYSVIWLAETEDGLPENVTTMIRYQDEAHGILRSVNKRAYNLSFTPFPQGTMHQWAWAARNMRVMHHLSGQNRGIPTKVDFFKMMHISSHHMPDFYQRWEKADPSKSLAVPLGLKDESHVMMLDLHEKAHGPHGLIAGTTGSGKSELLQSLILSLAVNFSPFDVGFLVIDYKGGGMADAFAGLPHLMGTITNLDAAEGVRAMSSIQAELVHRQKVFHEHHVSHIDDYMAIYRKERSAEPLPHLIIICDEFAELKKEHSEIISELISAARLGRSLGIHLLLATQKPAGVVDDQIWSNTRFRIGLRMSDEADSREILKTPDAAAIRDPGRAYLQVGNHEIYELFQSAYSSGIYREDKVGEEVFRINDLGQRISIGGAAQISVSSHMGGKDEKTEVRQITDEIRSVFDAKIGEYPKRLMPHPPWLPVLEKVLRTPDAYMRHDDREKSQNLSELILCHGMLDLPGMQAQILCLKDLLISGHTAYFAAEGFGKTAWLMTQTLSLSYRYPPSKLQFYMLDLSGGALARMRSLAHTAAYIAMDDDEKLGRFYRRIKAELKKRKRMLANCNAANVRELNKRKDEEVKLIVILIDQADAIREIGPQAEDLLHKIAREGIALGIVLLMTFGRNGGVRYATMNHIGVKIVGYMHDPAEAGSLMGTSKLLPEEIPGRCLIRHEGQYAKMQLFIAASSEKEMTAKIREINALYPGDRAECLPMMPDKVDMTVLCQKLKEKKTDDRHFGEKDETMKGSVICLGLTLDEVEPVCIDRKDMPILILGDFGRGKTNALRLILGQLGKEISCYLVDARKKDLHDMRDRPTVKYRDAIIDKKVICREISRLAQEREASLNAFLSTEDLSSEAIERLPEIWLLIDDIDDLITGMGVEELRMLSESMEILINTGTCVVVTADPMKLKGFDPVTQLAKHLHNGLLLSGQGTHNIFSLRSYGDEPERKNGIWFKDGIGKKIRVAKGGN